MTIGSQKGKAGTMARLRESWRDSGEKVSIQSNALWEGIKRMCKWLTMTAEPDRSHLLQTYKEPLLETNSIDAMEQTFKMLDKDGDGILTREELQKLKDLDTTNDG